MNNQRRKILNSIYDQLLDLKNNLSVCKDEEQDAFDNLPESLQSSEKGETMEQIISELEEAENMIDEALNHIDEAKQ